MSNTAEDSATTPAATTQTLESFGLCANCVSGWELPGEPRGKYEKIGPLDAYVVGPSDGQLKRKDVAIVFFCDAFGLELKNNKIIPDKLADSLGLMVYVPDYFYGDGAEGRIPTSEYDSVSSQSQRSLFGKIADGAKMLKIVPWILNHRPSTTYAPTQEFLAALKSPASSEGGQHGGYARLGGVGYCYGGKHAIKFNGSGEIDVSVLCHPSWLEAGDFERVRGPISFACAEQDIVFTAALKQTAKDTLAKKSDVPHEFIDWEDTIHGFAARPNLSKPTIKAGFEGAFAQTVRWFRKHLVENQISAQL